MEKVTGPRSGSYLAEAGLELSSLLQTSCFQLSDDTLLVSSFRINLFSEHNHLNQIKFHQFCLSGGFFFLTCFRMVLERLLLIWLSCLQTVHLHLCKISN